MSSLGLGSCLLRAILGCIMQFRQLYSISVGKWQSAVWGRISDQGVVTHITGGNLCAEFHYY